MTKQQKQQIDKELAFCVGMTVEGAFITHFYPRMVKNAEERLNKLREIKAPEIIISGTEEALNKLKCSFPKIKNTFYNINYIYKNCF